MGERNNWREQIQKLDKDINDIYRDIPSAFYNDYDTWFEGSEEGCVAIDSIKLPSKEEAIKILENKSSDYYDVLKARLCVAIVQKHQILEANLSPKELDELKSKNKGRGWYIPDVE